MSPTQGFFQITPQFAREMREGQFLVAPDEGQQGYRQKGDSEHPTKMWREVFEIEDVEVKQDGDVELVQVRFRVPMDVVSKNQGRTVFEFFRFPWSQAQAGDQKAKQTCSINYRGLTDLLNAIGMSGTLLSLDQIPVSSLRNLRINAQYKMDWSDDDAKYYVRIGGYRGVK